eukprot:COSAG01_NODE_694_length_14205_cov_228.163122_17_plen_96_part_00
MELEPEPEPEPEAEAELEGELYLAAALALMVEAMEGAKASALSPVMDEPEAPAQPRPQQRNARARLFVLLEAGVQPDDTKEFDRGRHTHTHRLAS